MEAMSALPGVNTAEPMSAASPDAVTQSPARDAFGEAKDKWQGAVSPLVGGSIKAQWDDMPSPPRSSVSDSASERDTPRSTDAASGALLAASTSSPEAPCERIPRVPLFGAAVAKPNQDAVLKSINRATTFKELLAYVAAAVPLMDHIHLVTCLYRLAKLTSSTPARVRAATLEELRASATFALLLRYIDSTFLKAHFAALNGGMTFRKLDARCLSNLLWALAKLDFGGDGAALTTSIALNVVPFVLRSLEGGNPQALANMLWSYAKLSSNSPALMGVIERLVERITRQLAASPSGSPYMQHHGMQQQAFDAQALSNSVWALAHLRSRGLAIDPSSPLLLRFVDALAGTAGGMLSRLQQRANLTDLAACEHFLAAAEEQFSCQALVNIAWSLATLLGPACAIQGSVRQLFNLIHTESVNRLHATTLVLRMGRKLPYRSAGSGGFNEQALSNVCFAFDKAGLLRKDLLGAVFGVAALRLAASERDMAPSFKPQELCTLLRACYNSTAPPGAFLAALFRAIAANPSMTNGWTSQEQGELNRAYALLQEIQQQQQQQQQAQQQQPGGMFSPGVHLQQLYAGSALVTPPTAPGCWGQQRYSLSGSGGNGQQATPGSGPRPAPPGFAAPMPSPMRLF